MPTLINLLFGCPHRNYTFPQTHRCPRTGGRRPMHVVCLNCGAEAAYDFGNMRPLWRSRTQLRISETTKNLAPKSHSLQKNKRPPLEGPASTRYTTTPIT